MKLTSIYILCFGTLAGCATAPPFSTAGFQSLDENTMYEVKDGTKGFKVSLSYRKYQFVPDEREVSDACSFKVRQVVEEYSQKAMKPFIPPQPHEQFLRVGRDAGPGVTFCYYQSVYLYDTPEAREFTKKTDAMHSKNLERQLVTTQIQAQQQNMAIEQQEARARNNQRLADSLTTLGSQISPTPQPASTFAPVKQFCRYGDTGIRFGCYPTLSTCRFGLGSNETCALQ